jgi:hypothetical protein
MKKLLIILLFIPLISFGQETEVIDGNIEPVFKITTKNGEVIRTKRYRVNEKKKVTDIQILDGKAVRLKSSDIVSITEIKEGWDYFEFKEEGFTDYVVVEIDSLNKEEMYTQVKNWILETYNTPSEVIKSEIKNKKIRIEGSKSNLVVMKGMLGEPYYYDTRYSIEISVRDGKYKFDPISLKYWIPSSSYVSARWQDLYIFNNSSLSVFYNQKGKKKGRVISAWAILPSALENHFDGLNMSLFNYIEKNKKKSKESSDDDW